MLQHHVDEMDRHFNPYFHRQSIIVDSLKCKRCEEKELHHIKRDRKCRKCEALRIKKTLNVHEKELENSGSNFADVADSGISMMAVEFRGFQPYICGF
mmetsp:Transcript_21083/g.32661  ORF Transcript_21083/g.32661 Transcript_21083/m.32661 type:complete len:98 (+) Transcript_21083:1207-1500(+)